MKRIEATSEVVDIASRMGQTKSQPRPWSGELDNKEVTKPGGMLLAALMATAHSRGQTLAEMASELGVTYGYIQQLRSGTRSTSQISDEFAAACAEYLMAPKIVVLLISGKVSRDDFYIDPSSRVADVTRAFEYIASDPNWVHLLTPEMHSLGLDSKECLVKMYERANGCKLLIEQAQPVALAEQMKKIVAGFEDLSGGKAATAA
jgi:transcriptional regulator with XRE-family HTH domain